MLLEPRKQQRAVSKVPYKVLDAPDLADDFYLNLVDWGNQNILGVGLGNCVYMWNSESGRVNKLCELPDDTVTSVSWIQRVSNLLAAHSGGELLTCVRVHTSRLAPIKVSFKFGMLLLRDD
jgi:cell division cycle 20-like protein 1, cofactor of APC complex